MYLQQAADAILSLRRCHDIGDGSDSQWWWRMLMPAERRIRRMLITLSKCKNNYNNKFIIKKHDLLAYYIVSFRTSALDCDAYRSTFIGYKCVTIKRHKQVSASDFPRHPLLSNVYVIEITTPRARRASRVPGRWLEIRFNRALVFSKYTFLGVFKKLA